MGKENLKNYKPIIGKLLDVHGVGFRFVEKLYGSKQLVEVKFSPKSIEQLKKWENDNGSVGSE